MHGVNLSEIGSRDPEHYGDLTYPELERRISEMGGELG
jgi:3-dehydroquinate dehydratase